MTCDVHIAGAAYRVRLDSPADISIPLRFYGPQPNSYGVPPAAAAPFAGSGFIGDTRLGGSCNFETVTLTPHCNGTHTECVGHITEERIALPGILREALFPATLISVPTTPAGETEEHYPVALDMHDMLITAASLRPALHAAHPAFLEALVLRTLPNDASKLDRQYADEAAAFFSTEAMELLSALPLRHLLVDLPSLDRAYDDGRMLVHRLFWGVAADSRAAGTGEQSTRTVTEFIYVPSALRDGRYLLNLQIAPFVLDAAPSRPLLFEIEEHHP